MDMRQNFVNKIAQELHHHIEEVLAEKQSRGVDTLALLVQSDCIEDYKQRINAIYDKKSREILDGKSIDHVAATERGFSSYITAFKDAFEIAMPDESFSSIMRDAMTVVNADKALKGRISSGFNVALKAEFRAKPETLKYDITIAAGRANRLSGILINLIEREHFNPYDKHREMVSDIKSAYYYPDKPQHLWLVDSTNQTHRFPVKADSQDSQALLNGLFSIENSQFSYQKIEEPELVGQSLSS